VTLARGNTTVVLWARVSTGAVSGDERQWSGVLAVQSVGMQRRSQSGGAVPMVVLLCLVVRVRWGFGYSKRKL
jgi:hypothetical protein